jgi:hypothetical protein
MAQVFSLNAVGYINVTLPPGFSMIANQLTTTNNNLSPMLDSQFLSGTFDGVTFYKYSSGNYAVLHVDSISTLTPFIPWDESAATNTTLNPGEGAFVYNPNSTSLTLTFVGTVPQGSTYATNNFVKGFNMVSSLVPLSGRLDVDMNMAEVDGDVVWIYNPAIHNYEEFIGDSLTTPQPWDVVNSSNPNPTVTVGQAFFYQAQAATTWVNNFSVN